MLTLAVLHPLVHVANFAEVREVVGFLCSHSTPFCSASKQRARSAQEDIMAKIEADALAAMHRDVAANPELANDSAYRKATMKARDGLSCTGSPSPFRQEYDSSCRRLEPPRFWNQTAELSATQIRFYSSEPQSGMAGAWPRASKIY
jgi:hypothetical protein